MTRKRPTLKTIADMTGLSLSTVSLSLRDGNNLKQATRDRVAQAAQEIGYTPNRAGVRLRTGRTNVLALVLTNDQKTLDFTRLLIQGIGAHIGDTAYHLSVIPEFEYSDPEAAVRYILDNHSADGAILTHTSARDPRVQLLNDAGFPFVSHGRTEFYTPHAYHDFNAGRFVELAVARLARKGRRNILLAAIDNDTTNYSNTVNAFKHAVAGSDLIGDVADNAGDLSEADSARSLGRRLGKHAKYDAVICNNELSALAMISGFQESGATLGQDYDLICKQTTEILPILYPDMDTVAEDLFATGNALAELLIQRIGGAAAGELQTLQEPVVHWRS